MGGESGSPCGGESGGSSSPKNKVKFLCSYGGKVLPRPSDGLLKYVGGETRVISVPRDVTFSELMKKVSCMVEGEMVVKYQLIPEDLDTLVSVRTEEDLKHMIEEHDRHESGGFPLLRAFLFPSRPVIISVENHTSCEEQRYIDVINGIMRTSPRSSSKPSPIRAFSNSSACSSPQSTSPDGHTITADLNLMMHEPPSASASAWVPVHRVRSSPSISSLSNLHSTTVQQQHHHQHQHPHSLARPAQDPQVGIGMGMGRPPPLGKTDHVGGRGYTYYYSPSRPHRGFGHLDDSGPYAHPVFEPLNSVPRSPRKSIWEY